MKKLTPVACGHTPKHVTRIGPRGEGAAGGCREWGRGGGAGGTGLGLENFILLGS